MFAYDFTLFFDTGLMVFVTKLLNLKIWQFEKGTDLKYATTVMARNEAISELCKSMDLCVYGTLVPRSGRQVIRSFISPLICCTNLPMLGSLSLSVLFYFSCYRF